MMLGKVGTSKAVVRKFYQNGTFDLEYFKHLAEIYLKNERMLYDSVHSKTPAEQVAVLAIKYVVAKDAIEQDQAEPITPSIMGIRDGVGGREIYNLLVEKITWMVERIRHEV